MSQQCVKALTLLTCAQQCQQTHDYAGCVHRVGEEEEEDGAWTGIGYPSEKLSVSRDFVGQITQR
jgi:hypothetical protein